MWSTYSIVWLQHGWLHAHSTPRMWLQIKWRCQSVHGCVVHTERAPRQQQFHTALCVSVSKKKVGLWCSTYLTSTGLFSILIKGSKDLQSATADHIQNVRYMLVWTKLRQPTTKTPGTTLCNQAKCGTYPFICTNSNITGWTSRNSSTAWRTTLHTSFTVPNALNSTSGKLDAPSTPASKKTLQTLNTGETNLLRITSVKLATPSITFA